MLTIVVLRTDHGDITHFLLHRISRLYNLAVDPREPEQTFQFSPYVVLQEQSGSRRRSRGGFGLDAAMALEAVSFCFGQSQGWGKLTAYGLMSNGDVFSLCPVLPSHR